MQPYTKATLDALTAPTVEFGVGCELLDAQLNVLDDISGDVKTAGTIRYDDTSDNLMGIDGFEVAQELSWGKQRVRPYMVVDPGGLNERRNLGVYMLTTPSMTLGQTPRVFDCSGLDQRHILQYAVGDTYAVRQGDNVLDSVKAALGLAGFKAPLLLDTTGNAAVFAGPMVWPVGDNVKWRKVVDDMLAAIPYESFWVDWDGNGRARPLVADSLRKSEFDFDVLNAATTVTKPNRKITQDLYQLHNRWVFTNNAVDMPVDGNGRYQFDDTDASHPSSQANVEVRCADVQGLDAVDQASLVAQGNRIIADELRVAQQIEISTSPLPIVWHRDIDTYKDADLGVDRLVRLTQWSLPIGGTEMSLTLETVI